MLYLCITCTVHRTVISIEYFAVASAGIIFEGIILYGYVKKHKIALYIHMFQHTELYLSFSKSQPRLYA